MKIHFGLKYKIYLNSDLYGMNLSFFNGCIWQTNKWITTSFFVQIFSFGERLQIQLKNSVD